MDIIDKLSNGAFVLARTDIPDRPGYLAGEIVLCFLPSNAVTPFITWQRTRDDCTEESQRGALYHGHYFAIDEMAEAEADYRGRVSRMALAAL